MRWWGEWIAGRPGGARDRQDGSNTPPNEPASRRCSRRALRQPSDSLEIRETRGGPLAEPGDPDAAAYAEGAALPNPGAKLAGPSFEEWLAKA